MKAILNIGQRIADAERAIELGCNPHNPEPLLTAPMVRCAVRAAGYHINSMALVHNTPECTFVLEVDDGQTYSTVDWQRTYDISDALGQDCIAFVPLSTAAPRPGRLSGPRSDKWGDFNLDYFVWPNQQAAT